MALAVIAATILAVVTAFRVGEVAPTSRARADGITATVVRTIDGDTVDVDNNDGDNNDGEPVNGSDAVFAAVAAAVWRHDGFPPAWPSRR